MDHTSTVMASSELVPKATQTLCGPSICILPTLQEKRKRLACLCASQCYKVYETWKTIVRTNSKIDSLYIFVLLIRTCYLGKTKKLRVMKLISLLLIKNLTGKPVEKL